MVKRSLAFGGILAILSGVGIYNNIYAATEGTTKFSVDVNNAVLELTIPSTPAVIDLNPTMTNTSFGSTSINVHVATNNQTGYTLTMTPTNSQEDTSLIRTELIGDEEEYREIETLEQTDPISTGYTEQTFTANAWGYKITGDNYYGIDPNNTTVSHPAWTTSAPTNGIDHNLTLAAKVDADTVSGAYETTLNFRAVTNAVVAKDIISFDANGGTGNMDDVSIYVGSPDRLPENTITPPEGKKFIGWSTSTTGSGKVYDNAADYIADDTGVNKSVTLYAIWANENFPSSTTPAGVTGTTISRAYEIAYTAAGKGMWERDEGDRDNDGDTNEYYQVQDGVYHNYDVRWDMQGMTTNICDSVTVLDDSYIAIDIRDFNKYHIAKLKDGRCWMQDNLALDPTDSSTASTIDNSNTNADSTALFALFNGNRSQGEQYSTAGVSSTEEAYSLYLPYIYKTYKDEVLADALDIEQNWKSGIYYNFCAASAGSACYSSYVAVDKPDTYIDAENDICPSSWRLPIGGAEDNEIDTVYSYYTENNSINNIRLALRLPLSGSYGAKMSGGTYKATRNDINKSGGFWTSTYIAESSFNNDTYRWIGADYYVSIQPSAAGFRRDKPYRYDGYSIRCIAK